MLLFAVPWLVLTARFLVFAAIKCRGPVPVSGHVYPPRLASALGCGLGPQFLPSRRGWFVWLLAGYQ